jgi:hypothetical protein
MVREWKEDARQAAKQRNQTLYYKVMLLHYVVASPKEREAMVEVNGWRPQLPTNMSLESWTSTWRKSTLNHKLFPTKCSAGASYDISHQFPSLIVLNSTR